MKAIELHITEIANGDPLKQLQLASALCQRMQVIRHLRDRDQEAWVYIRNSLKAFFEQLQDEHHGRYPTNDIRAAQQAVCAAIANAVPARKLHLLHKAVGISVD